MAQPTTDWAPAPDQDPERSPIRKSRWSGPEAMKSLEKTSEWLVIAYLVATMNDQKIPLKEFMDDFEKNTLLTCLRLTRGNQKNAAAVLGIKPTALFEKMRKHRINGKSVKWSEKLAAAQPGEME